MRIKGRPVSGYEAGRSVLRDPLARQAGFKAEMLDRVGMSHFPVLFLSGEAHRRQRTATARFFAPKIVETRYRELMIATSESLVARLTRYGSAVLDDLALELAVMVAAEIVGLTASSLPGMTRRLGRFFHADGQDQKGVRSLFQLLRGRWNMALFYWMDVRPAIAARRRAPGEDVISHLLAEGYPNSAIMTECLTYGAAGMVTTREFITMAAWHLVEDEALRARYLGTDERGRLSILEEILRLEPVIGALHRRPEGDGDVVAIDIRAANGDATAVGVCPFQLDPDRTRAPRVGGAGLAFGDGEHRCPGAGVALQEAMIFLDRLLRVPGLAIARQPDVFWNDLLQGYELRGMEVVSTERGQTMHVAAPS